MEHHFAADPFTAIFRKHGYSPNMAVREKAGGSNKPFTGNFGQNVQAEGVRTIDFEFRRNALFPHEHLEADFFNFLHEVLPIDIHNIKAFHSTTVLRRGHAGRLFLRGYALGGSCGVWSGGYSAGDRGNGRFIIR